jgi:two-component system, OmpR family, sensor histidine kinase VicK
MKSAKKEMLIIFFTANALHSNNNEQTKLIQLFKEAVKERGVKIRIMMPTGNEINYAIDALKEHQQQRQQIDIQYLKKSYQADIAVFVVDNAFSLTVESKRGDSRKEEEDKDKDQQEEVNIAATYSTVESTVMSYISIFETLWIEKKST